MPKSKQILKQLFPQECILNKLSIGESGRSFSIRKSSADIVVAVDLRKCANWPKNKKITDGLFLCLPADSSNLLVVLVELKGADSERAIKQLNDTTEVLCSKSQFSHQPHNSTVLETLVANWSQGHFKRVLGIVVTRRSLSLKPPQKKKAREQGLKIKYRTAKSLPMKMAELREWFD